MTYNYGSPITGTLIGTTLEVLVPNLVYPATIVLNSSDETRAIEFSLDSGVSYYPAITPTGSLTGQIYYVLTFPVAEIKFTGVADDTYSII